MKKAVEQIDPIQDTAMVVEQLKTGYRHPPPLQFEDLGRPDSCLSGGGDVSHADATLKKGLLSGGRKDGKGVSRKQSMHQKIFGGGDKHKSDSNADYGQLPPQQRARRLQAKLCELEKEREKIQHSRDGLAKMKQVYTDNPKMGNPADCETQLCQYEKEIECINQQINKFHLILEEVQLQNSSVVGLAAQLKASFRRATFSVDGTAPRKTNGASVCVSFKNILPTI
ncbi:hypothetical protein GCK32_009249 [Trichostrongylus colubriformis]|uniref:REM-1 domain-containing protein n=1 Tax=Trichostrongylus colubriformis TaxID=6319 RepID=A0AAN8IBQ8_TRICO